MLYIMLFCAYPFERPEDVWLGPKKQAQANAQRIMAADYQLPASPAVSSGCRDLLSRILVPGPQDRITVAAIQRHPWFREVGEKTFPPFPPGPRLFGVSKSPEAPSVQAACV